MDLKDIIKSQYRASLAMMEEAIKKCSDTLWNDENAKHRFWHIAYHTLFFTHLYLQVNEEAFVPWAKHRNEHQFFESVPWAPEKKLEIGEPYTKAELLEYLAICQNAVEENVTSVVLKVKSGFDWLPFSKLELQFYNIRHIQHHTAQLDDRLRNKTDNGIRWIGAKSHSHNPYDPKKR